MSLAALSPLEAREFRAACAADPLYFARVVWGRRRWSAQRELRRAVAIHPAVVCWSANGVGKTSEIAAYIIEDSVLNPGTRWTLTGPRFDSVKEGIFSEIKELVRSARIDLGGELHESEWILGDRWDVACTTAAEPSSYQGRRGLTRTRVCIDEAQGDIAPEHWDALLSLLTGEGSQIIALGNPITTGGRFLEIAHSQDWHRLMIDGFDHPNVKTGRVVLPGITKAWVEARRKEWGEEDPRWIARVRGRFPDAAADQLIASSWFDAGENAPVPIPELQGRRIGFDVARHGDDKCVLSLLENGVQVHQESWGHARLHESAARLIATAGRFAVVPGNVKVDRIGIGAGVVDECFRIGWYVDAVDFGAGPAKDWPELTKDMEIKNRRAELHWIAARLLERRHAVVPANFPETRLELVQPRYSFRNGVFRLEEKEEIKKRIGRSPDFSDSFVLALSNVGSYEPGVYRL